MDMIFLPKPDNPAGGGESRRRKRRPWTLPRPPVVPSRGLEGGCILDEVGPPLGLVLWQRFRDVRLWAMAVESESLAERDLFAEQGEQSALARYTMDPAGEDELAPTLRTFASLVLNPRQVDREQLVSELLRVARWAGRRGADGTESCFTALAASVSPLDPVLACAAGKAERKRANYGCAIEWFRLSVALARRFDDHPTYIEAYLCWGTVEERLGWRGRAKKRNVRAFRRAREAGLTQLGARARHNMLSLLVNGGEFDEACRHAEAAFALYGSGNPKLAALASDTAALACEHGYYAIAIPLVEAALPLLEPNEQNAALANLARMAAMLNDTARFFSAWTSLTSPTRTSKQFMAQGLAQVSHGARILGLKHQAVELATAALELAERRGEPVAVEAAQAALAALREDTPPPVPKEPPAAFRDFATRLAGALRQLAPS